MGCVKRNEGVCGCGGGECARESRDFPGTLHKAPPPQPPIPPASSETRDQLAIHAPPVPDHFMPGARAPKDLMERMALWPWYYADQVLAKRGA